MVAAAGDGARRGPRRPDLKAAGRWRRRFDRLGRGDRRALAVLVGVPLVAFVVPALAGYPAIAGDNLIQNFPLRVLSGQLVRHGHLPLWNRDIWSGSPLLGGLNAGSLYPLTLVFAVVPAVAAWVLNLLAAYWAAGLGTYALCRRLRLGPLPSGVAAATYAFSGQMAGQMVHLPIVQGIAWIPLMVLAQFELSWALFGTRPGRRGGPPTTGRRSSPWPPTVLLAVVIGLVLLAGEPRGMAEAEVVASVVALWLLLRPYGKDGPGRRRRLAFLGYSVLAAAWASALGAVQLLPGWQFISTSQRSSESFAYFATGSLHVSWSVLLLVPDIFGGDGLLHQPAYFNSYNLPEVTGYVGLLPLVAFFALLTRAVGRRRDPQAADWWPWLGLAVLGMLMAFGSYTPAGGLFGYIPFFNKVRLQSRNLAIADLALAVVLAYWLERALADHAAAALRAGWRRRVALLPVAAAALACVAGLAVPGRLESAFSFGGGATDLGRLLTPSFVAQLVVVAAAGGLVVGWPRLSAVARRRAVVAVVVLDLGLFTLTSSTGLLPGNVTLEPSRAEAVAAVGDHGRFAIYDTTAINVDVLSRAGQPDLNAFTGLPSVQGYGSIVAARYGDPTGTHTLDTLSPCALAKGLFDPLRLATLLVLPQFLARPVPANTALPASPEQFPATTSGLEPANCRGAPAPGTPTRRRWYFGRVLPLGGVDLVKTSAVGGGLRLGGLRVGIVDARGRLRWPAARLEPVAGGVHVTFTTPAVATGLVVHSAAGQALAIADGSAVMVAAPPAPHRHSFAVSATGATYALDGQVQDALDDPARWRYAGEWRGYARFVRTTVRPPVWVAGTPPGDAAHLLGTAEDGTAEVSVRLGRPAVVVRSEAFMPGWRVTAVPVGGGASRVLPVVADGLVQAVHVPAGRYTLTFRYRPPGLDLGLAGSGAGLAAFVVLGLLWVRRRRRRGVGAGPPPAPRRLAGGPVAVAGHPPGAPGDGSPDGPDGRAVVAGEPTAAAGEPAQ
ncbi:MAG: hypothetical protein ACYCU7_01515 [Acidimicrobiales bacterium]